MDLKLNHTFKQPLGLVLIVLYKGIWGLFEVLLGVMTTAVGYLASRTVGSDFVRHFFAEELAKDPQDIFVNWLLAHVRWLDFSVYVGIGLIILGLIKLGLAVGVWFRSWVVRDIGVVFFSGVAVYGIYETASDFYLFKAVALFLDILILFYFWHMLPKHLGTRKRKNKELIT